MKYSILRFAQGNSFPSWYPAAAGAIVAIGSNTLDDVVSTDKVGTNHVGTAYQVMANWSGGALVYKGGKPYLFVHGGGHGDCSINGIYKFGPLAGAGSDSPVWSIEKAMSRSAAPENATHFSDGQPNTSHTYNQLAGDANGVMWRIGGDGVWSSGADSSEVDRYDSSTGNWDAAGTQTDVDSTRVGAIHGSAVVASNGKVYYVGGNSSGGNYGAYNPATKTWQTITQAHIFANYVASAYDTARGLVMSYSQGSWQTINTSTHATATGSTSGTEAGTNNLEYDAGRDVYVTAGRGNRNLYELNPASKAWSTRTLSGATPDAGHTENNGHFGRFRYVPELNGFIYAPAEDTQVYFLRST